MSTEYFHEILPLVFYALGSICFFVGSAITAWRIYAEHFGG